MLKGCVICGFPQDRCVNHAVIGLQAGEKANPMVLQEERRSQKTKRNNPNNL